VTSLLPDVVREAVRSRSDYSASGTFGVVALVLFLVLLLEREIVQVVRASRRSLIAISAVALPLGVAVALEIWIRVVDLLP
jgi:hypothetical protein